MDTVDRRVVLQMLVLSIASLAPGAWAADEKKGGAHWGYSGETAPDKWGDLEPDFAICKTGKNQSPINITGAVPSDLDPITFDYASSPLRLIDTGHTVQVNYAAGSSISVSGKRYDLLQFHFHRPSEERVNGKAYDMVAHLVHKGKDGKLAVVAVLLEKGREHPILKRLWRNLPKTVGKETVVEKVAIDASTLLPADRAYYTFAGSLTTPPCSEGVTWFVMKNPVPVSAAQIDRFAKIYKNNARPVQPLNGRAIRVSK